MGILALAVIAAIAFVVVTRPELIEFAKSFIANR
jgi:hypothetical protein